MCYTVNELDARSNDSYKDNLNVVFVIDTRIASDKLEETKEKILDISRTVLKNSSDSRIYIFEQNTDMSTDKGYKVYSAKGNRFFTDYNTLAEKLKEVASSGTTENSAILSDAVGGIISVCDLSRETYAFSLFSQENVIYRTENGYAFLDSAVEKNVDISVIAEIDDSLYNGYAHDMYKRSGGIFVSDNEDYTEAVLNHIYGKKVNKEEEDIGEYQMILATGLRTVKLDYTVANIYELHKDSSKEQPDTDSDGLSDYEEINFDCGLIKFVNGFVELPTYGECIDYKSDLTYVERGLYRFDNVLITDSNFINYIKSAVRVLPIVSDPTSEDGDKDTVPDDIDIEPLVPYLIVSDCIFESDNTHSVSKHALIACVIDDEASYRCLNCDECFIAPESQDSLFLNENEYAIIQALRYTIAQLINSGECNLNYIESLYMIIDEIRSSCTANGSTFYDYSDKIEDLRYYTSPMNYLYGKDNKEHSITISEYQTTKSEVYIDMQAKLIISYGLEFVSANFLPPIVYPTFVLLYDIFTYNTNLSDYLNFIIMKGDCYLHNSSSFTGVGFPESFSSLIGIGNLITVCNYSKSFNAITDIVDELYHNYMYDVTIQINDLSLGTEIYMVKVEFDSKLEAICSKFKKASSDENLRNYNNVNTFQINNYTDEKNISEFKKEICKGV